MAGGPIRNNTSLKPNMSEAMRRGQKNELEAEADMLKMRQLSDQRAILQGKFASSEDRQKLVGAMDVLDGEIATHKRAAKSDYPDAPEVLGSPTMHGASPDLNQSEMQAYSNGHAIEYGRELGLLRERLDQKVDASLQMGDLKSETPMSAEQADEFRGAISVLSGEIKRYQGIVTSWELE